MVTTQSRFYKEIPTGLKGVRWETYQGLVRDLAENPATSIQDQLYN